MNPSVCLQHSDVEKRDRAPAGRPSARARAGRQRTCVASVGLCALALSVAALSVAAVSGCGRSDRDAKAAAARAALDRGAASRNAGAQPLPADSLYDREGQLLPSGERIGWLELPRGLTKSYESGTHRVFQTVVPLGKVQGFFAPRLITGEVERVGDGVVYRRAKPPSGEGEPVDVSVLPSGRGTRVEIAAASTPKIDKSSEARRDELERALKSQR